MITSELDEITKWVKEGETGKRGEIDLYLIHMRRILMLMLLK